MLKFKVGEKVRNITTNQIAIIIALRPDENEYVIGPIVGNDLGWIICHATNLTAIKTISAISHYKGFTIKIVERYYMPHNPHYRCCYVAQIWHDDKYWRVTNTKELQSEAYDKAVSMIDFAFNHQSIL